MFKKTLILSIIYMLLLTACGQTGPLYLPQKDQAVQNAKSI